MLRVNELCGFGNATPASVFEDLGGCQFDGGDYYVLSSDFSGLADGKLGTISFWYRQNSAHDDSSTLRYFIQNIYGSFFIIFGESGNDYAQLGLYGTSSYILKINTSNNSFESGAGWVHYVASWDLGNTTAHVYVNGVSDANVITAPVNQSIDYTKGKWGFGASSSPGNTVQADVAQFYFNPAEYVDLSNAANLKKFYNGGPVDFGSDGSTPTGTSPIMFVNRTATGAVTDFDTNAGTGGSIGSKTGTLTASSNIPSTGVVA